MITNKSLIAADHVQRFFLIAFLFESGPISISLPALHNINISSSATLAGKYYWIQNLIIKIVLGYFFLAFKRASHLASPFPRTRTRPLDKKLCFQRAAYPKNLPNPLKLTKKVPKAIWASFYNNHPTIGPLPSECIICSS